MCRRLIKQLSPPNPDFEKFAAVQIGSFVTDMYEIALRKARQAEDTPNLSSDEDTWSQQRRKTIPNTLFTDFALGESMITTDPPILNMEVANCLTESNNVLNLDNLSNGAQISHHSLRASSTTAVNTDEHVPQNLIANDNDINASTVDKNGNGIIQSETPTLNQAFIAECPHCENLLQEIQTLTILVEANQKWITDRFDYMSTKMQDMFTLISLNNIIATCDDVQNKFPITSLEDMEDFENQLKHPEFKQKILKHLRRVGGSSPEDSTRRLWRYLLSVELQYKCNWTGLNNKKALRDTLVNEVIENAVQQSFGTATIKTIQTTTKDYIQHASNRFKKNNAV